MTTRPQAATGLDPFVTAKQSQPGAGQGHTLPQPSSALLIQTFFDQPQKKQVLWPKQTGDKSTLEAKTKGPQ